MLSALKRLLSVLIVVAFVVWALARQRGMRAGSGTDADRSIDAGEEPALEAPTEPAQRSPAPGRWEPPGRSAPLAPHSRASVPGPADEAGPGSRSRGRIEDLLERAKNEDEGAA